MNAGYSGTPLARKLGIGAGTKVFVQGAPHPYKEMIAPVPEGVTVSRNAGTAAVIHCFVTRRADLERNLQQVRKTMMSDAAVWISWPKKASKVVTDITEDIVREVCLPLGLVDIKVCAVDETWSGLKLMIRRELREKAPAVTAKKTKKEKK